MATRTKYTGEGEQEQGHGEEEQTFLGGIRRAHDAVRNNGQQPVLVGPYSMDESSQKAAQSIELVKPPKPAKHKHADVHIYAEHGPEEPEEVPAAVASSAAQDKHDITQPGPGPGPGPGPATLEPSSEDMFIDLPAQDMKTPTSVAGGDDDGDGDGDSNADADADADGNYGTLAADSVPEATTADLLFTDAMRAELTMHAMAAAEDVAAPLAATIIKECRWKLDSIVAREKAFETSVAALSSQQARLLHAAAASRLQTIAHLESAVLQQWRAQVKPSLLKAVGEDYFLLRNSLQGADDTMTIQAALEMVATSGVVHSVPALARAWAGTQALRAALVDLEFHALQAKRDARALRQVHEDAQADREDLKARSQELAQQAYDACRAKLHGLSNTFTPPEGTKRLAPPHGAGSSDSQGTGQATDQGPGPSFGGRHQSRHVHASSAAVQAARATRMLQMEAGRRALQTRVAYELHMLENCVQLMSNK